MKLKKLIFLLGILPTSIFANILLVGNKNHATLSIIDIPSNTIKHVLKTGVGPHEVAISPNQKFAAVSNYGDNFGRGNSISIVDIQKKEVIKTITRKSFAAPHGIQWFKDNRHFLITAEDNQTIVKVDFQTEAIKWQIGTKANASHMLVVSNDEKMVAVSNLGSGSVSLIDLENKKLLTEIKTGKGAEGIDISPNGKFLWVTNRSDDNVVIDLKTHQIIKTLTSEGFPIRVKISSDGKYALVTNARANTLSIFDAEKLDYIKTLSFKQPAKKEKLQFPIGVLIEPDSHYAYVAFTGSGKVAMIDMKNLVIKKILDVGPTPDGMGYVRGVVF